MSRLVFGYEVSKVGPLLMVSQPGCKWTLSYNLHTKDGYIEGKDYDNPGCPNVRVAFMGFEGLDNVIKLVKLLRSMVSQNRPTEREDSYYD